MGRFPWDRGVSSPGRAPGGGPGRPCRAHLASWPWVWAESRLALWTSREGGQGTTPLRGTAVGSCTPDTGAFSSPTDTLTSATGHWHHGDRCHSNLTPGLYRLQANLVTRSPWKARAESHLNVGPDHPGWVTRGQRRRGRRWGQEGAQPGPHAPGLSPLPPPQQWAGQRHRGDWAEDAGSLGVEPCGL